MTETVIQSYRTLHAAMEISPPSVHFLYGTGGVYHTAMLAAAEQLRRGGSVAVVDAANVTDPFFLAQLFKSADVDPEPMLRRGYISRCYTFYQVDVAITDGLLDLLRSVKAETLMIFGLLDLIDDDQVAIPDLHDIMARIAGTLKEVSAAGISTLLVSTPLHCHLKEREHYFDTFSGISDVIYRLDAPQHRTTTGRGRNGKTDRHSHTAHRQRAGAVGKLPPRPPQRTAGALR